MLSVHNKKKIFLDDMTKILAERLKNLKQSLVFKFLQKPEAGSKSNEMT